MKKRGIILILGLIQYFGIFDFLNIFSKISTDYEEILKTLSYGIKNVTNLICNFDGPSFLFYAIGISIIESILLKFTKDSSVLVVSDEFLARRILVRDRLCAFCAYYLYGQQFFQQFSMLLRNHNLVAYEKSAPFILKYVYSIRCFVATHWVLYSFYLMKFPYLAPVTTILMFKYILRRRNGYDTIWLDPTKRFEYHNQAWPTFKHFVRYNWCVAFLLDVSASCSIQITETAGMFFDRSDGIWMYQWVIYYVYMITVVFFCIGAGCSLLGLRGWCPFLHRQVTNQVGVYNPPGRIQSNYGELDLDDFDPLDDNNPYYKFRF